MQGFIGPASAVLDAGLIKSPLQLGKALLFSAKVTATDLELSRLE
jgi:hypothetical protein